MNYEENHPYLSKIWWVSMLTLIISCLCSCANTQYKSPYSKQIQVSSQKSSDQRQETQRSEFRSNTGEFERWHYSKEYEQSLIEKGATQDQFERLYRLKIYEQSLINEGATPAQLESCRHMIEEMQLELKGIEQKGIANRESKESDLLKIAKQEAEKIVT